MQCQNCGYPVGKDKVRCVQCLEPIYVQIESDKPSEYIRPAPIQEIQEIRQENKITTRIPDTGINTYCPRCESTIPEGQTGCTACGLKYTEAYKVFQNLRGLLVIPAIVFVFFLIVDPLRGAVILGILKIILKLFKIASKSKDE
jgi:hypothetical protein